MALAAALLGEPVAPADGTTTVQTPIGEIEDPVWLRRPPARRASAAYPMRAMQHEKIGVAVVRCSVTADGSLASCSLVCEGPSEWGFGAAAMRLAPLYQMAPRLPDGRSVEGGMVTLPFYFNPPFFKRLSRCDGVDS